MFTLNGWWFLSSGGSYPPVFTVLLVIKTGVIVVAMIVFEKKFIHPNTRSAYTRSPFWTSKTFQWANRGCQ